jgi:hypothetical protein
MKPISGCKFGCHLEFANDKHTPQMNVAGSIGNGFGGG